MSTIFRIKDCYEIRETIHGTEYTELNILYMLKKRARMIKRFAQGNSY